MVTRTGLNKGSSSIPFKKTVLALSVMAVANAHAQTTPQSENVEEVVTTGIRQNIINAQQIKRNAETFVDAISAEDIGSLPDASVLEALQRIPGISIERFAAPDDSDHFSSEGSNITLRGLPQTRTSFNGRDSFSANSDRGLSFEDVSKDLLGSVEVVKNQTADMIEGGISGTVTLNTRKPFDSDGRQLAFSAQGNYNDFSEEWTPEYSGLYSDIFDVGNGELGVLVSFSESRLIFRSDGTELGKHTLIDRTDVDGNVTEAFSPTNAGIRSTTTERFRRGVAAALQYRSDDSRLETTLELVRSESSSEWTEFAFFTDDIGGTVRDDARFNNGVFRSGFIDNITSALGPQTRSSDTNETIQDISLNVKFQATDRLALSFDVQSVDAENDVEDLTVFGGLRPNGGTQFAADNGGRPIVQFFPPAESGQSGDEFYTDPTNYFFRAAMDHLENSEADLQAFQIDLDYEIDSGIFRSVEAGVRFAEREQTTRWSRYNWANLSESWNGGQIDFAGNRYAPDGSVAEQLDTPSVFALDFNQANFHRAQPSTNLTGLFISPDVVKDYAAFNSTLSNRGAFASAGPRLDQRNGGNVIDGFYLPQEVNPTTEENQALYIKLNFGGGDTNRFSGNVGFRYVQQETIVEGGIQYPNAFQDVVNNNNTPNDPSDDFVDFTAAEVFDLTLPPGDERRALYGPGGAQLPGVDVVASSDFDTILPSLNLKYELTDDLIARFAFSKAVSFPSLGALRYNYFVSSFLSTFDHDNDAATAPIPRLDRFQQISGNPFLKPMEADNYDLSIEWYFDNDSSLTAGVFYKNITNFFATGQQSLNVQAPDGNLTGVIIPVEQPVNVGDASLKGLEIGYSHFFKNLPDYLDGLGVQFNFTRLLASDVPNQNVRAVEFSSAEDLNRVQEPFDDLPLQGMSDTTFNIVAMYETEAVSARLAYNYRSDYLLSYAHVNHQQPVFADSTGTLDGSFFYRINDMVQLGVQGSNLTNTETKSSLQVDAAGTRVTRSSFVNDRRYAFVVRVSL